MPDAPRGSAVESSIERLVMSLTDFRLATERARLLSRMVSDDPSDQEARTALESLRRDGIDPVGSDYVLGHPLDELVAPAKVQPAAARDDDAAWIARILKDVDAFLAVGLRDKAADLLSTVLRIDPHHAGAWDRLEAMRPSAPPPDRHDATRRD